MSSLYCA